MSVAPELDKAPLGMQGCYSAPREARRQVVHDRRRTG